MKKLFVTFLIVILSSSFVSVFAQSGDTLPISNEAVNVESTNVNVELSLDTQDPGTKEFFARADITSIIDSDRVIIEWYLGNGIKFAEELESSLSRTTVKVGEVARVQKRLVPVTSGIRELKVVVTVIKADVNYVATDKITIEFNQNKEIIPLTEEYKEAKLTYQITRALMYLVVIFGILIIGFLVYLQIKKIRA